MRVSLTKAQARLVLWACEAGLEQQLKFLRHDGWNVREDGKTMSKKEQHEERWADRKLLKAIKTMERAIRKAGKK